MDIFKKNNEFIIIDNFREHFPGFPKGRLIKSESPDFIVKTSPKYTIGIELTALPSSSYILNNLNISSFIDDLQHSILKKEEKLKSYQKKKCNEYWLLIHADSIVSKDVQLLEYFSVCSGFRRIYLFSLFEGEVKEITDTLGVSEIEYPKGV